MSSKFKIGEKVRIVMPKEVLDGDYSFIGKHLGLEGTITGRNYEDDYGCYVYTVEGLSCSCNRSFKPHEFYENELVSVSKWKQNIPSKEVEKHSTSDR